MLPIVVVLLFVVVGGMNFLAKNDLKNHGVIVNAKIIEYLPPGKAMSDANYRCEFIYKGEIKRLISQSRIRLNKSSHEGQYFPALYSEKYDELRILMTPEDFDEFGIIYPDSLLNKVIDVQAN
jgi:hypothetical protein